jgi:hypothetical protein
MPGSTERPEDLHRFRVEAADGPFGTVSEVDAEHLIVRVRHGLGRHDDLLVPRILIEEVDRENKRIRLSASRAEILHMLGVDPQQELGAWFGGVTTSAQQPFPPTLPGPGGAPDDDGRPEGSPGSAPSSR